MGKLPKWEPKDGDKPLELDKITETNSKICIFTNKYCRYARKEGPGFECKAPDDDSMTCR